MNGGLGMFSPFLIVLLYFKFSALSPPNFIYHLYCIFVSIHLKIVFLFDATMVVTGGIVIRNIGISRCGGGLGRLSFSYAATKIYPTPQIQTIYREDSPEAYLALVIFVMIKISLFLLCTTRSKNWKNYLTTISILLP